MPTIEILCIALLVFSAFCALVQAVKEVLLAKLKAASDFVILPSGEMVPGTILEIPPGTEISPATVAAPPGYRANLLEVPPAPASETFDVTHVESVLSLEGEWEETGRRWVTTYRRKPNGLEVVGVVEASPRHADLRTTLSAEGVEDVELAFKRAAGEVH